MVKIRLQGAVPKEEWAIQSPQKRVYSHLYAIKSSN